MSSHRKEWEGTPGLGTTDPGKGGQGRESSTETSSDPEKWVISSPGTWALGRAIPLGNPQRSRPGQQPLATPGDFSSSQPSSTRNSPHPALPGPQLKCPGPPAASRSHISTHPPPQKVPPDGAGKDPHPGERETPRENGPTTSGSPGLPSHPSRASGSRPSLTHGWHVALRARRAGWVTVGGVLGAVASPAPTHSTPGPTPRLVTTTKSSPSDRPRG